MMRSTSAFVLGILLITAAGCGGKPAEDTAEAVLARAVTSMGGDAALAKVVGVHLKYEGTYKQGEMESPFTSEIIFVWPNRALWTLESTGFKGAMGMDGETGWSAFMAPVARVAGPAKESLEEWPIHQDIMLVRPLLHRKDVTLRLGEVTEKDGVKVETVLVAFEGKGEFVLVLSTEKGRTFLTRMSGPQTLMDGRKGSMESTFTEPKAFGDVTMMTSITMKTWAGGKLEHTLKERIVDAKWNPEVTDETFAMPKLDMKLDTVAVKDLPAGLGLVVVHEGPYENIAESFGKAFALATETKTMFMPQATCIFLNNPAEVADPKDLRTEVIVALMPMGPPPTKAPEGSELRAIPAVKVAAMTVRGPYGIHEGESIGRIMAWLGQQNGRPAGPPRVLYMHNPAMTVPEDQVSEVQVPIAE